LPVWPTHEWIGRQLEGFADANGHNPTRATEKRWQDSSSAHQPDWHDWHSRASRQERRAAFSLDEGAAPTPTSLGREANAPSVIEQIKDKIERATIALPAT
jgi:hypothetical protein